MNEREAEALAGKLTVEELEKLTRGIYPAGWLPLPSTSRARLEQASRILLPKRRRRQEQAHQVRAQAAVQLVDSLLTTSELERLVQGEAPPYWAELNNYSLGELQEAAGVALRVQNAYRGWERRHESRHNQEWQQQEEQRRAARERQAQQELNRAVSSLHKEPSPFLERLTKGVYPADLRRCSDVQRAIFRRAAEIVLSYRAQGSETAPRREEQEPPRSGSHATAGRALNEDNMNRLGNVERQAGGRVPQGQGSNRHQQQIMLQTPGSNEVNNEPSQGATRNARLVPQQARPQPIRRRQSIYHITHIDNLPSILASGCLWCECAAAQMRLSTVRIGYSHLKNKRMDKRVPQFAGHVVGDYVPFYFAPRSPMLYTINRGNVEGYDGGQVPILHLVSSVEAATASCGSWLFTDGNATSAATAFYDKLADLDTIDWDVMDKVYWNNTAEDPDRERRRQAEFLVHHSFPWTLVQEVGVISEAMVERVHKSLAGQSHRPAIVVRRDWYY